MSITFFQFSSVNLNDILSKVIPALFTNTSTPFSSLTHSSIKFSIPEWLSNLKLLTITDGKFFLIISILKY